MKSLMIARSFSGREKIIKVEGAYHGWFDEAQVSVHPDLRVAWREREWASLAGKTARLRVQMRRARLFSFWFDGSKRGP